MVHGVNGELSSEAILEKIKSLGAAEPAKTVESTATPEDETAAEVAAEPETAAETDESPDQETEPEGAETEPGGDEIAESGEEPVYQIGEHELTEAQITQWKREAEQDKKGGMLEADYRKKTAELATQRKTLDALDGELKSKLAALESLSAADDKKIDWEELRDFDPSGYLKKKEEIAARDAAILAAQQSQKGVTSLKAQEEAQLLTDAHPTWTDTQIRDAEIKGALNFAEKIGFKDGDLNSLVDHRVYIALIKAAKYDALEKSAPGIKKQLVSAPKVLKPKARSKSTPQTDFDVVKARLRKTGSNQDAQAAIKMLLQRRNK